MEGILIVAGGLLAGLIGVYVIGVILKGDWNV